MSEFHLGPVSLKVTNYPVPDSEAYLVYLEVPDGFGEEARSDQV